ncbi:TPA: hypothetical protein HA242_06995 [Candidatus Woesearchaeota archaeon]|nr:hypothetical protein [Candidatus Woesearchaeota archaeon]
MTIKNIRVINNPPHFTEGDVNQAGKVFSQIIPKHKRFNVYFYRLLLFPNNLALLGTSMEMIGKRIMTRWIWKTNNADVAS